MKKFLCTGVLALLFVSALASAGVVTKVVFEIDNLGVTADFTAAVPPSVQDCGTLDWTKGSVAKVYTNGATPIILCYPTISATFTNGADTSADGLASAVFGDMNFTVSLYTNPLRNVPVGTITGMLYNSFDYTEQEISLSGGSVLDGAAVIALTSFNVPGFSWIEEMGAPAGLRSETSLTYDITDYQSDWHSSNTVVTILADESGIPEPATMSLLALGGLLLRKRS
ncbi:MAG: hypothetical protein PHP01_04890 [Phycisphaerae bacterium]|nr:hypothetical protein [Phycisphaerae bacterium]